MQLHGLHRQEKTVTKRHVHQGKHDALVEEVVLLEVDPEYSHARLPSGRETSVLASLGEENPSSVR